ncbi:MAG: DUF5329 domain-containing protein [Hymenobacteraceae bacterium]|nr:DUF5329 domain-containing protein [Hymenobacteraceae bacterium]MDX5396980.1 DUF5329 domain-containing protein [Hymenobacteraceae bacterium]MDX5513054.1 DUF5329 domain-containing protein [Hymenobacteraceae bacterium]
MNKKIFATFSLLFFVLLAGITNAAPDPKKLTEEQKITHLIKYIREMDGAVFIRNGSEYSAARAAEHLELKRENAGSRIKTAEDFIKVLASKSSMSGKPYYIRLKDGRKLPAEQVLMKELKRIETSKS